MKPIICPICQSELKVDETSGVATCPSCGTTIKIADQIIHKTEHIVDEARIKEAEVELKRLEEQKRRDEEAKNQLERKRKTSIILVIVGTGLVINGTTLLPISVYVDWIVDNPILQMPTLFTGIVLLVVGIILLTKVFKQKKNK